jgi:hypothetical protein
MKRDMDLVRKILFAVEEAEPEVGGVELEIEGYDEETVFEHLRLLAKAGYLEAFDLSTLETSEWRPARLTWSGHDFLDAARNDSIWTKAKSRLLDQGVGLSIELLKAALISVAKEKLGL